MKRLFRKILFGVLMVLLLPYLLLKCLIVLNVILDAPPNYEGEPRHGTVMEELMNDMRAFIREIYRRCCGVF